MERFCDRLGVLQVAAVLRFPMPEIEEEVPVEDVGLDSDDWADSDEEGTERGGQALAFSGGSPREPVLETTFRVSFSGIFLRRLFGSLFGPFFGNLTFG